MSGPLSIAALAGGSMSTATPGSSGKPPLKLATQANLSRLLNAV